VLAARSLAVDTTVEHILASLPDSTLTFCTIQSAQEIKRAGFLGFTTESVKRYGAAGRFQGARSATSKS
jgi:hypothetical protein